LIRIKTTKADTCTLYGGSKNSSCGAGMGEHFTLRAKADKKNQKLYK
jgi:hypothetical protein